MAVLSVVMVPFLGLAQDVTAQDRGRVRDFGIDVGILPTGQWNAITDVEGVLVGHTTLIKGDSIRTGVTAILPHGGNIYQQKVPSAVYVGNGYGKLAGSTQVEELGQIETPVVLTNTLGVSTAVGALVKYTINLDGNERVGSVNGVVGETNDGWLNDIRGFYVREEDVWQAIRTAASGPVGASWFRPISGVCSRSTELLWAENWAGTRTTADLSTRNRVLV